MSNFCFQVNIDNLEEYISLVVDATVKTGIARQMEAFRAGFNQVILLHWICWNNQLKILVLYYDGS